MAAEISREESDADGLIRDMQPGLRLSGSNTSRPNLLGFRGV
jgi:hypothetical protein